MGTITDAAAKDASDASDDFDQVDAFLRLHSHINAIAITQNNSDDILWKYAPYHRSQF